MIRQDDTVVALATGSGAAGLAVIRISGPSAVELATQVFSGFDLRKSESHRAHHGFTKDLQGALVDEVLALVLLAPHSYTGDDTVEFFCHGSPQVVDDLIAAIVEAGARVAEPGEFTRRAFLNGRIDLTQAEAVVDLIESQSRVARRSALEQLRGKLTQRLKALRQQLLGLLADIEASIDFVEEGIEFFGHQEAVGRSRSVKEDVENLLATAEDGVLLRSGVHVSLAGSPNVGKSRLFNSILQQSRSIVTKYPGTTTDIVRETIRLGGVALVLEDTAGLTSQPSNPVEAIGVERSQESHARADVVLFVIEAGRQIRAEELKAMKGLSEGRAKGNTIVVLNKIDRLAEGERENLLQRSEARVHYIQKQGIAGSEEIVVAVSAATGEGVNTLLEEILNNTRVQRLSHVNDAMITINQRHRETLLRARNALEQFEKDAEAQEPPELLAANLRNALSALDEMSGEQFNEEVLDKIFARFCIGK